MSIDSLTDVRLYEFLTLSASAGIFSALIGGAVSGAKSFVQRKRKAKIFALELNLIFDAYFRLCFDSARNMMTHLNSSGHHGKPVWKVPFPPDVLSDNLRWENLNAGLVERAMALPVEATYRQRLIDAHLNVDPGEEVENPEIVIEHLVALAKAAYLLAADLRRKYGCERVRFSEAEFAELNVFEKQFTGQY